VAANGSGNSGSPASAQSSANPHLVLDATSLYNSVAAVFLPRYDQSNGPGNHVSNTSTFCDGPKNGTLRATCP